jgi:hypothetical protein
MFEDEFTHNDETELFTGFDCECGSSEFTKSPDIHTTSATKSYIGGHVRFDTRYTKKEAYREYKRRQVDRIDSYESLDRKHNS